MRRILDAFKVNKQKWISEVSLWLGVIIFPWDCPSCLVNLMFFHLIGSIEKLRNVKLERCWCSWHNKWYNPKAKPSLDSKSAHVTTNSFRLDLQAVTWSFHRSVSSALFCCVASYLDVSINASLRQFQEFWSTIICLNYSFKYVHLLQPHCKSLN